MPPRSPWRRVAKFVGTSQKNGAFLGQVRDRGHAQLHPLVAGFRPPRPRLSGVPWIS
nr:MAG TPA: hypothetical protein [Caudoviricetes sp.]